MCRSVVDDGKVVVNYKRSCLEAMTLLLHGTAWSKVKSLPSAMTCRRVSPAPAIRFNGFCAAWRASCSGGCAFIRI
jgi:hypothetical protein